jgi:adenylate kinase
VTRRVVALTGVSGVGKSTLLGILSRRLDFLHLQASGLIKKGREALLSQTIAHDQLRDADLDENQQLLIRGFEASVTDKTPLVVLDSHTVIEQDGGWFLVGPEVFGALQIDEMIFLRDDPTKIAERRKKDAARGRPSKDGDALATVQMLALENAEKICRVVRIPLKVLSPEDVDSVVGALRGTE